MRAQKCLICRGEDFIAPHDWATMRQPTPQEFLMHPRRLDRRRALMFLALASVASTPSLAQSATKIAVTKDPSCGCCGGWIDHLRGAGIRGHGDQVAAGQPYEGAARRAAEPVVLPHGRARAICRGRPRACGCNPPPACRETGCARAGGCRHAGRRARNGDRGHTNEDYDVVLFGPSGQRVFARYNGTRQLSKRNGPPSLAGRFSRRSGSRAGLSSLPRRPP